MPFKASKLIEANMPESLNKLLRGKAPVGTEVVDNFLVATHLTQAPRYSSSDTHHLLKLSSRTR